MVGNILFKSSWWETKNRLTLFARCLQRMARSGLTFTLKNGIENHAKKYGWGDKVFQGSL